MFNRKAVSLAVASLLASSGFAVAGTEIQAPRLSLDPTVVTADSAAAPQGLLMQGLDKVGAAKPLNDLGINVYGFLEGGYTYNHRHGAGSNNTVIVPGPFNHEFGNHFMLNQVDLRFEKLVDPSKGKFDVGGLVEVLYGTDAARIHSTGLGYNGSDPTDNNDPADPEAVANLDPQYQFDIPQMYVDVALPVGNGLQIRAGKFTTLLSYETIDPRGNPFYSHSYLFSAVPFTQTGVLAMYQINDQWKIIDGFTRGWDVALEPNADVNGKERCNGDNLGEIVFTPNKQWTFLLNWTTGPENAGDTSHWRTAIDPIVKWQATDAFSLGFEGLYVYDGGRNGDHALGVTHGYADVWGGALYASYVVNDYLTINGRAEKAHTSNFGAVAPISNPTGFTFNSSPINAYEVTLGVTIKPMPKDPIGQNLSIRPEVRYDFTDAGSTNVFYPAQGQTYRDQLTFGADFIFTF